MSARTAAHIKTDVVVVGGGPAGCALTALLASGGIRTICIDRDDAATTLGMTFDGRTTAISFGSRRVMDAVGAWDSLSSEACPIEDIRITDSGSPTLLQFLVREVDSEAFGWIVENRKLRQSLYAVLKNLDHATHIAPSGVVDFAQEANFVKVHLSDGRTISAALVVGADGKNSFTREWMGIGTRGWTYRQRAIACIVRHENPHNNVAVEDFREEGPFAILPMADDENGHHRSSIVWTEHGADKDSALHWDEALFNTGLAERFPQDYGKVSLAGQRFSYPLGLKHAHSYIGPRMALVADAAHAIHPIAGQGLNLGLRDIAALAELILEARRRGEDIGSEELLRAYQSQRRFDNMAMAAATDALNRLFSNGVAPVRLARKIGLKVVQKLPSARKFFMKQAMGSSGLLPTLIRTGKLPQ